MCQALGWVLGCKSDKAELAPPAVHTQMSAELLAGLEDI